MSNIKLHVCMAGFHPEENFNNIKNLLHRMRNSNTNIDLEYHIIFKSNEAGRLKKGVLAPDMRERLIAAGLDGISFFSYESSFLKRYGDSHRRAHPSSLTIQHEPLREIINHKKMPDNDFILKTRTDIHIDDHFIDMFLDERFYESLKATEGPHTVFEFKIWNPLIGPRNIFEFTDYFFLSRVKELKQTLVQDHQESEYLWNHPVSSCDHVCFAEKLQYIKPLLPVIERANIRGVDSEFYWNIVNNNFLISYIGEGNDPRRPVLDRNKK